MGEPPKLIQNLQEWRPVEINITWIYLKYHLVGQNMSKHVYWSCRPDPSSAPLAGLPSGQNCANAGTTINAAAKRNLSQVFCLPMAVAPPLWWQHFGDMESLWNHCGICNLKASVAACLSWNLSFARYLQCVQAEICNLQILATSWNYLQFAMHLQHFDTSH